MGVDDACSFIGLAQLVFISGIDHLRIAVDAVNAGDVSCSGRFYHIRHGIDSACVVAVAVDALKGLYGNGFASVAGAVFDGQRQLDLRYRPFYFYKKTVSGIAYAVGLKYLDAQIIYSRK